VLEGLRGRWEAAALAVACAAPPPAPPPAPRLGRPAEAIPADLDVVVRIDLGRVRAALGPALLGALAKAAAPRGVTRGTELLERVEVAWIALRPGETLEHSDAVVVLRGRFGDFAPPQLDPASRWEPAVELGGAWRRWDLRGPAAERISLARVYARAEDVVVAASTAEIDAVERVLEAGARDGALQAPERGALSLALRAAGRFERLARRRPELGELLHGARVLTASADVTGSGLRADAAVEFADEASAGRALRALRAAAARLAGADGALGQAARAVSTEAVATSLQIRLHLDRAALDRLVASAAGP
jgi:hypothetical protein